MTNLDYDPKRNDPQFVEPQNKPTTPEMNRKRGQLPDEGPPAQPAPPPVAPVANAPITPTKPAPPPPLPPASTPKSVAKPPVEAPAPRPPPKPPQAYDPPPVKPMERWGDDYWAMEAVKNNPDLVNSRFLPTEQEAPGVLGGANRQLAAFSAPAIAGPANIIAGLASIVGPFFDLMSNNAFSQHYRMARLGGREDEMLQLKKQEMQLRMREDEMKFKRERMIDMAEGLQMKHSQMLSEYKSVFDNIGPNGITEDEAREQIAQLNQYWHHGNLNSYLQDGDLAGVANALNLEHNKFLHSWAATATLRSADKTRKEEEKEQAAEQKRADLEAPYRKQGSGAAAPGGTAQSVIGYTAPGQPPGTAAAGTAPTTGAPQEGTTAEDGAGTPASGTPDADDPQGLKQSPALSQADTAGFDREAINDVAEDLLFADKKPTDFKGNEKMLGFAIKRENEMRKQINDIRNDHDLKGGDAVYDKLAKISPRLRSQVEAIVNGGLTPPVKTASGEKQPWPMLLDMARKVEPRLDTILQTRPATLRDHTTGPSAKQHAQLGTAYAHGDRAIADLKALPDGFKQIAANTAWMPKRMRDYWYPEASAAIGRVEKDLQIYASESGAVLAYGRGTYAERKELTEGMNWAAPNTTIAAIQEQQKLLRDRDDNVRHNFTLGTGMNYDQFRGKFVDVDPKIRTDNPDAEFGFDAMDRDRTGDKNVHDWRELFPEGQ